MEGKKQEAKAWNEVHAVLEGNNSVKIVHVDHKIEGESSSLIKPYAFTILSLDT